MTRYPEYAVEEGPSRQENQGTMYNTSGYNDFNSLQIRLNTEPIQRQIEMFLRGKTERIMRDKDTGEEYLQEVSIGEPLANEKGVQNIMLFVELVMNTQVVQGNFKDEYEYEEYLVRTRKDLAKELIVNLNNYEIKRNHYQGIISKLMRFIEVFMTRPKDNKERDSYASTIRSNETLSKETNRPKSWLPF